MPDNPKSLPAPAENSSSGGGGSNGGKPVPVGSEEPEGALGTVKGWLGEGLFQILLDNGTEVRAHLSGQPRVSLRSMKLGRRVLVDISPYDATRCRVLKTWN